MLDPDTPPPRRRPTIHVRGTDAVDRRWIAGPGSDLEGFLDEVADVAAASDLARLREIAREHGLAPTEAREPDAG